MQDRGVLVSRARQGDCWLVMQGEPQVTKQVAKSARTCVWIPAVRKHRRPEHNAWTCSMREEKAKSEGEGDVAVGGGGGRDTSANLELYYGRQSKIDCAELHGQHARIWVCIQAGD